MDVCGGCGVVSCVRHGAENGAKISIHVCSYAVQYLSPIHHTHL